MGSSPDSTASLRRTPICARSSQPPGAVNVLLRTRRRPGQQRAPQPRRDAPLYDLGAAPQARLTPGILPSALRASLLAVPNRSRRFGQHRREHVRPPWRHGTQRGQHRRTHRDPRHPRPLWPRDAPPPTRPKAKAGKTTRSGNEPAGPCSARCRELVRSGHRRRDDAARAAEIPPANIRSAPKPVITRPPSTRRAVRKGRLNFLYFPEGSRIAPAYRARSRVRFTQVKRPPCDKGCIVKIGVPHGPNDRQCWQTRST